MPKILRLSHSQCIHAKVFSLHHITKGPHTLLHIIKHRYLQSLVDDAGRTGRASRVVIQLLLQAAQQTAEVCGRVVGPSSTVLDGAECLWKQTQLPETLLEKTLSRFRWFV